MPLMPSPFAIVRRLLPRRPGWFYAAIMAVVALALAAVELNEEYGQRKVDRLLEDI